MSRDDLRLFSYEILGLVGSRGAGAHDLLQMARSGRMLDWAGESQYYVEPKRLAALGYLASHKEPGRTRERTVYTLTEEGLAALREWARTPVEFTPVKSEALTRMLIADLVGEKATREGIASLRDDLEDVSSRLDDAESRAAGLPHREKYLRLSLGFLRGLLQLHLDWIEEVERELSPAGGSARRRRAATPRPRG
jgi:PadR family transcriptional regulator, regulatory protein AphA